MLESAWVKQDLGGPTCLRENMDTIKLPIWGSRKLRILSSNNQQDIREYSALFCSWGSGLCYGTGEYYDVICLDYEYSSSQT